VPEFAAKNAESGPENLEEIQTAKRISNEKNIFFL